MKKLFFLLSVFICCFYYSQTHRFVYEFQYKSDSTSAEYQKTTMVLDVNPEDVRFYPYQQIEVDSLNKIRGYKSTYWDDEVPTLLRKRNTTQNSNFYSFDSFFKVDTKDDVNWQLSPETKNIANYNLQKATCDFGGRTWEAWFATNVPINEGPYKFAGLPGLVFQVNDDKGNFNFKLIKSYKLDNTYDSSNFVETFGGQKALLISQKQLDKLKMNYFLNPLNEFKESFKKRSEGDKFFVMNVEVKSVEQFKELTEKMQNHIRKRNNSIELDKIVFYPLK